MYTNRLKIVIAFLLLGCVIGFSPGILMAQEIETPVETPIETPTETPVIVPTSTPIPVLPTPTPTTAAETPVETPTETPVEIPTNTPVPVEPTPTESAVVEPTPTETPVVEPTPTESAVVEPTPTESAVVEPTPTETSVPEPTATPVPENIELILSAPEAVNTGDSVNVSIEIKNAVNVDAFGFDILQSNAILGSAVVQNDGTLTSDFAFVLGNTLDNPVGAVRIAAAGGASSVNGDGLLLNIQYTAQAAGEVSLSLGNILDDLIGADVMTTVIVVSETAVPTPTETGVPEPTPTEVPEPTPTEVTEPTPTETGVVEPTPTETGVVEPTPTPTKVPEPTATPIVGEPTATPTVIEVNPDLGLVSLDELGGTYPRGNAVHNFDIGISNRIGQLVKPGEFDGQIDPDALGPFLFIKGQPFPIAKDLEFTGEIKANGNGSEGVYFLMGGSIGNVPPVNGRLGATGGPNNGGIDIDNNGETINFGTFKSDIVPVLFMSTEKNPNGEFLTSLVDVEPAGNGGFYVLTKKGKIYAEGAALEALDTVNTLSPGSTAVGLKIWRGKDIDVSNSQYSSDLIGTGAYILDSAGAIHIVGDAPALQTENLPVVPMFAGSGVMQDIEFIPNAEGTEWIGLGILMGDGMIEFAPFADQPAGTPAHLQGLLPFGNLPEGFPINIARDFEIEISESTIYGLDESGATVAKTGRRVGIFMFDGFGGVHVGGASTRFAPALIPAGLDYDGSYVIDGQDTIAYPVSPPYTFNIDVNKDVELAWPVKR